MARLWMEDLRDATDEDGPSLDAEALASLDRGMKPRVLDWLAFTVDTRG